MRTSEADQAREGLHAAVLGHPVEQPGRGVQDAEDVGAERETLVPTTDPEPPGLGPTGDDADAAGQPAAELGNGGNGGTGDRVGVGKGQDERHDGTAPSG